MIRKIATAATGGAVTTTDYIDGFVYVNSTLSYFAMPEGRMVNTGGHLTPEYVITDKQGNARITFDNKGAGNSAHVIQENSYYGFGMVMPGSAVPDYVAYRRHANPLLLFFYRHFCSYGALHSVT